MISWEFRRVKFQPPDSAIFGGPSPSSWENSVSAFFQPSTRTIFGSELLVQGISVCYSCFGGVFFPMDLRYYLDFISRKLSEKILFFLGALFYEKLSGANFWFEALLSICSWRFSANLPTFLHCYWFLSPRSCP